MADIKKGYIFFDDNPYTDTNPVPPKPVKAGRDGVFCVQTYSIMENDIQKI